MKSTRPAAVAAIGILLSGCATVVSGTSEDITVNTPPITGALCALSNPYGTTRVVSPGIARVERSRHPLNVRCSKPGFLEGKTVVESGFEPWSLGNVIWLGGYMADTITGAIQR